VRRWLTPFSFALAGLILTACILPFHDEVLEPHPDGTDLGILSASFYRIFTVILGSLPFSILAIAIGISRRFDVSIAAPWKAVAATFVFSLLLIAWIFRRTHF
jgi:hypothetical protein